VDASSNVFITDENNNRIQKFDGSGKFLLAWGCANVASQACPPASGPGQFNAPYGVAVDSSGNVFITDIENNRVEKFEPIGDPCAAQEAALDNFSWGDYQTIQEAEKAYRYFVEQLIECRRKYGLLSRG
jgi:DNA-binding beta-propeller fold protein YncE